MDSNINLVVYNLMLEADEAKINQFISKYQPFIIKVASETKNGYIDAHNDEELSIALIAFHEAMKKYEYDKGNFLSFARLTIASRLKNYWKSENRHLHEDIDQVHDIRTQDELYELQTEIHSFEAELAKFKITFEDLVNEAPIHKDTKERATDIGIKTGSDRELMFHLYEKHRLPITKISNRFRVSIKIIKRSKTFITATALVVYNKFSLISEWLTKKVPKFK